MVSVSYLRCKPHLKISQIPRAFKNWHQTLLNCRVFKFPFHLPLISSRQSSLDRVSRLCKYWSILRYKGHEYWLSSLWWKKNVAEQKVSAYINWIKSAPDNSTVLIRQLISTSLLQIVDRLPIWHFYFSMITEITWVVPNKFSTICTSNKRTFWFLVSARSLASLTLFL